MSAILTVVENGGPPLLGRDWLRQLRLDWSSLIQINNMRQSQTLDDILIQNSSVFGESGVFSDRKVKILQKHHCTIGTGLVSHGKGSMLISLDPL